MALNFLGVGFSFGAKDKGLRKMQSQVHQGFVQINDQVDTMVDKASKASKKFSGATDSMSDSLKDSGDTAKKATASYEEMANKVSSLEGKVKDLEKALKSGGKESKTQIKVLGTLRDMLKETKRGFDSVRESVVLLKKILQQSKLQTLIQSIGVSKLMDMANDLPNVLTTGMQLTTGLESQLAKMGKTARASGASMGYTGKQLRGFIKDTTSISYSLEVGEETAAKAVRAFDEAGDELKAMGFESAKAVAKLEATGVEIDALRNASMGMTRQLDITEKGVGRISRAMLFMGEQTGDVPGALNQMNTELYALSKRRRAMGSSPEDVEDFMVQVAGATTALFQFNQDSERSRELVLGLATSLTDANMSFKDMFAGVADDAPQLFQNLAIATGSADEAMRLMTGGPADFMKAMSMLDWSQIEEGGMQYNFLRGQLSQAMDPTQAEEFLLAFKKGNTDAGKEALKLIDQAGKATRSVNDLAKESFTTGRTLQESFDRSKESFIMNFRSISRKEARSFVRDTGKEFGKFNKQLRDIAGRGGPMSEFVKKMAEAHQLGMMAFIPKTLRPMTTVFGEMATQMAPVATGLGSLGLRFKHLFNPITLVTGGALAMGAAFVAAENSVKRSVESLADSPKAIRKEEKALRKLDKQLRNTAEGTAEYGRLRREYDLRKAGVESAKNIRVEEKALRKLNKALSKTTKGTKEYQFYQEQIAKAEGNLAAERKAVAERAREESKARIKDMARKAVEMVTGFVQALPEIIRGVVTTFKDIGPEVLAGFGEVFTALSENKGAFEALLSSVGRLFENVFASLGALPWDSYFKKAFDIIGQFFDGMFKSDESTFAGKFGSFIGDVFVAGIKAGGQYIYKAMGEAFSGIGVALWDIITFDPDASVKDKFLSAISSLAKGAGVAMFTYLLMPGPLKPLLKGAAKTIVKVLGLGMTPLFGRMGTGMKGALGGAADSFARALRRALAEFRTGVRAAMAGVDAPMMGGMGGVGRRRGKGRIRSGASALGGKVKSAGAKAGGKMRRGFGKIGMGGGAMLLGGGALASGLIPMEGMGMEAVGTGLMAAEVASLTGATGVLKKQVGKLSATTAQVAGKAAPLAGKLAAGLGKVAPVLEGAGAIAGPAMAIGTTLYEIGTVSGRTAEKLKEVKGGMQIAAVASQEFGTSLLNIATLGAGRALGLEKGVAAATDYLSGASGRAAASSKRLARRRTGLRTAGMTGSIATQLMTSKGGKVAGQAAGLAGALGGADTLAAMGSLQSEIEKSYNFMGKPTEQTAELMKQKEALLVQLKEQTNISDEKLAQLYHTKKAGEFQKLSNALVVKYAGELHRSRGEMDGMVEAADSLHKLTQDSIFGQQQLANAAAKAREELEGQAKKQREGIAKLEGGVKSVDDKMQGYLKRYAELSEVATSDKASAKTKAAARAKLMTLRSDMMGASGEMESALSQAMAQGVMSKEQASGARARMRGALGSVGAGAGMVSTLASASGSQQKSAIESMRKKLRKGGAGAVGAGVMTPEQIAQMYALVDDKGRKSLDKLSVEVSRVMDKHAARIAEQAVTYQATLSTVFAGASDKFTEAQIQSIVEAGPRLQDSFASMLSGAGSLEVVGEFGKTITAQQIEKWRETMSAERIFAKLNLEPITPEEYLKAMAATEDPKAQAELQQRMQAATLIDPQAAGQVKEALTGLGDVIGTDMEKASLAFEAYQLRANAAQQAVGDFTREQHENSLNEYIIGDFDKAALGVEAFAMRASTALHAFAKDTEFTFVDMWMKVLGLTDEAVVAIRDDTLDALGDLSTLKSLLQTASAARAEVQAASVVTAAPVLEGKFEEEIFRATHWPQWYTNDYRNKVIQLIAAIQELKRELRGGAGGRSTRTGSKAGAARSKFSSRHEQLAANQGAVGGNGSPNI
jgi:hypothetical protein